MTKRALPDDPMDVRADEFGLLRIFAMDDDDVVTRHGLATMVGATLDPDKVEVVETKDIAALGLAGYLTEGYGLSAADLADDAEALNAIDGRVALIPTSAFGGSAVSLSPSPPLRFVGIFAEADAAPPTPRTPSRSSELPDLEPQPAPEPTPPVSRPWRFIVIALALAVALVLWAVL